MLRRNQVTTALVVMIAAMTCPSLADLAGYTHYKEITVQDTNIDSNLTAFPLLIRVVDDTDLGGQMSAANDFRITNSSDVVIDYEVEYEDLTGGTFNLVAYAPLDLLASGGGTLRIWVNTASPSDGSNATGVWDANYVAVYHMTETSGGLIDSTSNNHDTNNDGDVPTPVTGKIYNGQDFDGNDSFNISDASEGNLEMGLNDFSGSMWVELDSSTEKGFLWNGGTPSSEGWSFWYLGSSIDKIGFYIHNGADRILAASNAGVATDDLGYHLVGFAADRDGNVTFYEDGASVGTQAISSYSSDDIDGTVDFGVGRWATTYYMDGVMDEIRISNVLRSAAWFKFEHRNHNETDNELTFGSLTAAGGEGSSNETFRQQLDGWLDPIFNGILQ
jgi:hypothetical protein